MNTQPSRARSVVRRYFPSALAIVLIVVLAVVVEQYSNSRDAGVAVHAITVTPVVAPGPIGPSLPECALPTSTDPGNSFVVEVTGECQGVLPDNLTCRPMDEVLNASAEHELVGGGEFYLTIIVPEFHEEDTYEHGELYAQVAGASTPRWANRSATVVIEPGRVHIPQVELQAEAGTAATGSLTLGGDMSCPPFEGE